jgi:hypothetical protein
LIYLSIAGENTGSASISGFADPTRHKILVWMPSAEDTTFQPLKEHEMKSTLRDVKERHSNTLLERV